MNRPAAARLLALTFLVLVVAATFVRAQPPASPDPWGFDDEVKVETWADILRPQALDIALTAGLIGFALFSFSKRSKALKYTTLVFTFAYLGVMKSTMISVTDIFRVVDLNLPEFKYSVAWYLFAGFSVVSTIVWGRLYCGRMCAFGAFTQLLDATVPKRLRVEPPLWLERRASYIKYGLLVAVVGYYITTKQTSVYRYVEPFWMFTRSANALLWMMLAVLAHRHDRRPECLLPVSVPRRRDARNHLAGHDGSADQAVVGVQHVQDLRAGMRVGRDSGSEDHQVRVRAV